MHYIEKLMGAKPLLLASLLLLAATAYLYFAYGPTAYFVAFHKPFHLVSFGAGPTYTPPVLPHFRVSASLASQSLYPGGTQIITVTETADRSVPGYLEVWLRGPIRTSDCTSACTGVNVYQNDTSGKPTEFVRGKTRTFTYQYTAPDTLRAGTYKASYIITSKDTFTDYAVHNNFAEFTVL